MLQEYQRILVAVDGSESANRALRKAVAVAKRNDATLFITHVIDTRDFQLYQAFDASVSESAKSEANSILNACKLYAENQGLTDVRLLLEYGSPKKLIARDLPNSYNIDLIMLGATGLNTVERFFIGSVSENVVRSALCDVLVVRTDTENNYEMGH